MSAEFKRIKELKVGDKFMFQGRWYQVNIIDDEGLWYDSLSKGSVILSKKYLHKFGVKSQMFVQVEKADVTHKN